MTTDDYTELVKRLRTFEHSIAHPDMWDKMNAADAIEEQAATVARLEADNQVLREAIDTLQATRKADEDESLFDAFDGLEAEVARLSARLEAQATTYEIGYSAGESSQLADWDVALDGLLPEDVGCRPLEVAAWIARLSARLDAEVRALHSYLLDRKSVV